MAGRNMRDMQRSKQASKKPNESTGTQNVTDESQLSPEQRAQFNNFKKMAKQYEGKSQNQLMSELKQVAARQRKEGQLDNAKLQSFKQSIAPMLDAQQAQKLNSIISMLKK